MITAWRIVKKTREREAFSGEGARRYGGRWNHRGTPVVYVSDSLSLAALELFVHLGPAHRTMTFATFSVDIPDGVAVHTLAPGGLPENWREEPPPDECKQAGTNWVEAGGSAVLQVPSVVVPIENNYVVNVGNSALQKLKVSQHDDFMFDPRMWK